MKYYSQLYITNFSTFLLIFVFSHLDMLILNAGVFGLPYEETEDKLDRTFQVNHLSHMYLTLLLEPLLRRGSRVVFVSSESHRYIKFCDLVCMIL